MHSKSNRYRICDIYCKLVSLQKVCKGLLLHIAAKTNVSNRKKRM